MLRAMRGGLWQYSTNIDDAELRLVNSCLDCYDRMCWDEDRHNAGHGSAIESEYSAQSQLHFSAGSYSAPQWIDEWLSFLKSEKDTPKCRVLPAYDDLRNIVAEDSFAGVGVDHDYGSWADVVLPTLSVHVVGVDRRHGDEIDELSDLAMHHVNVCVPFSSCLCDDIPNPDQLMARLAIAVQSAYLETARGRHVLGMGVFKRGIGHHKKKRI